MSSGHSIYSASYVNKIYFVKDITKFNTRLLHPESTTSEVVLPQLYCRMANPCTVQEYTLDIPFQNKHHHFNIKVVICCIIRCRKWEKKERGGDKSMPPTFHGIPLFVHCQVYLFSIKCPLFFNKHSSKPAQNIALNCIHSQIFMLFQRDGAFLINPFPRRLRHSAPSPRTHPFASEHNTSFNPLTLLSHTTSPNIIYTTLSRNSKLIQKCQYQILYLHKSNWSPGWDF